MSNRLSVHTENGHLGEDAVGDPLTELGQEAVIKADSGPDAG